MSFRADNLEEAADHFDGACADLDLLTGQEEFQARCLEAFGALRVKQDRLDEAESLYLRSLQLRKDVLGPNHLHVSSSLESLCLLDIRRFALAAAESHCLSALEIRRRNLGDGHADVARSLSNLAPVKRLQGRYEEAEDLFQQARSIYDTDPSRFGPVSRSLRIRLAWVSWLRGRYEEAEARYREALDLANADLDAGRGETAQLGIGLALWKQGRLRDAEENLAAVHASYLEKYGSESQQIAWSAWGLAGVYRDLATPGDLERAEPLYRKAVELRRRSYAAGHEYRRLTERDYEEFLERRDGEAPR